MFISSGTVIFLTSYKIVTLNQYKRNCDSTKKSTSLTMECEDRRNLDEIRRENENDLRINEVQELLGERGIYRFNNFSFRLFTE